MVWRKASNPHVILTLPCAKLKERTIVLARDGEWFSLFISDYFEEKEEIQEMKQEYYWWDNSLEEALKSFYKELDQPYGDQGSQECMAVCGVEGIRKCFDKIKSFVYSKWKEEAED